MLCGHMGYSRSLKESVERRTFVKEYKDFKVLTDSLVYLKLNDKTFFLEKKFRHGLTNASETVIMPDSLGFVYQFSINPREGRPFLNSSNRIELFDDYYSQPDTVKIEIWSHVKGGEKLKKIGDAVVF